MDHAYEILRDHIILYLTPIVSVVTIQQLKVRRRYVVVGKIKELTRITSFPTGVNIGNQTVVVAHHALRAAGLATSTNNSATVGHGFLDRWQCANAFQRSSDRRIAYQDQF